jgi:membrane fusion protein (multidrug efflux system)
VPFSASPTGPSARRLPARPSIRRVDLGAQVGSDTVLTRLENLSPMLVEFQVPEQFFSIARPGLMAEATTPAWPGKTFTATLSEVDTSIDPVSRTFRVRAQVPNESVELASGMFMRLTLQLSSDGVVMIPEQSITMEEGTPFVFVVRDGKVERRDVQTGGREPGWVQITDGLTLGEEDCRQRHFQGAPGRGGQGGQCRKGG